MYSLDWLLIELKFYTQWLTVFFVKDSVFCMFCVFTLIENCVVSLWYISCSREVLEQFRSKRSCKLYFVLYTGRYILTMETFAIYFFGFSILENVGSIFVVLTAIVYDTARYLTGRTQNLSIIVSTTWRSTTFSCKTMFNINDVRFIQMYLSFCNI